MRILVFGASGRTGREVVRQALARDHAVTAFVRAPTKLRDSHPRLGVVEGDVGDAAAVRRAVPDHDVVVSTLGVGVPLKHDPAVIAGIHHIVAAMREAGVVRLIYQSFIGVAGSRAAVGFILRYLAPLPLREEIADHEAKEAIVRASGTDWTIVRPPKLTDGSVTGSYRVGEDVAHFIVREAEAPGYVCMAPRLLR
jgi:putative NADH-flavin reductase